jgi:hypothetical protein
VKRVDLAAAPAQFVEVLRERLPQPDTIISIEETGTSLGLP